MLFARLLKPLIKIGTLHIVGVNGKTHTLRGAEPGPDITIRFLTRGIERKLLWRPALALGEAYMDGSFSVDGGDIYPLMDLLNRNIFRAGYNPLSRLQRYFTWPLRMLPSTISAKRAHKNATHSYGLDAAFYSLFLDKHMQYSCGYFPTGNETLEEAQEEKILHLASKLLLKPGMNVLDIGCGWGGLSRTLASFEDIKIHGITLSQEQLATAKKVVKENGQSTQTNYSLTDYRNMEGKYDRIISVGMFEHVGTKHFDDYFKKVSDLLTDDGVALIHFIGRMEGPGENNPWLSKYIFPGAYAPALSEVTPSLERHRLFITDMEVWRQHYAMTLHEWRKRLLAQWETVEARYDERFCRMFDFYLAGSEAAFRRDTFVVYQLQLAKKMDAAPLSRDYIEPRKNAYRAMLNQPLKKAS